MESPLVRYTLLTLAGSAIWCFAFAGAGYLAGDRWEDFHHAFRYIEYVIAAVIAAGVAWLVVRYVRRRRRRGLAEDSAAG
jgi:membrane protein DedA with SNARE-associated domain